LRILLFARVDAAQHRIAQAILRKLLCVALLKLEETQ